MSNPEGSIRPVDLRVLVPNEASDEEASTYSLSVAHYWLEGVDYDHSRLLFREGTIAELFVSATSKRALVPKETLVGDELQLREEMEHVLLYLEFDQS